MISRIKYIYKYYNILNKYNQQNITIKNYSIDQNIIFYEYIKTHPIHFLINYKLYNRVKNHK